MAAQGIEVWTQWDRWYVSNLGKVYNPKTSRTVGSLSPDGYVVVKGQQAHRLVCAGFDGPISAAMVVHHIDHDRKNNRLDNLACLLRAEHSRDAAHAGPVRHRSGESAPLPPDADEWVRRVVEEGLPAAEALRHLGRSSAWLALQTSRRRAARLPTDAPLTPAEREAAHAAALRGEETMWRVAPDDPDIEISNLGRARYRLTGKIRTFRDGKYPRLRSMWVHQAVMVLYGPPSPFPGALVRHFPDPTPTNCSLANLRWGDEQDNAEDSIRQGLLRRGATRAPSPNQGTGRGRHHSRLTDEQVTEGLRLCVENRWTSGQLASHLGISQPTASQILNGRTWRHIPRPVGFDAARRRRAPVRREGCDTARRLWADVDAITQGLQYSDADIFVTRDELIGLSAEVREKEIAPALFAFLRAHVERWGWFYPRDDTPLDAVLAQIRATAPPLDCLTSRHIAGVNYLKSRFPSFWQVDGGPVRAFASDTRLRSVIRYRIGLNTSKLYTYTLRNGSTVQTRETFDLSLAEFRKGFVVQRMAVSFFKPSVAAAIWRMLGSHPRPTVWDASCGFGARLLGFAAMYPQGVYFGNEPASRTVADVRALALDLPVTSHISEKGSEFANFEPHSLDMVFTSPPYFDVEKYYDEPGQCWKDYPKIEDWEAGYLLPTLDAARRGLRPGSPLVLNVGPAYADRVTSAANRVGFRLDRTLTLVLGRDVLNGTAGRTEPVLVFS